MGSSWQQVYAFGRWWSYSEIARTTGANRFTVRHRHQKQNVSGEELFGEHAPEDADVYRFGKTTLEWTRIREFALRTTAQTAAQVYGVPEEAVRLAVESDWAQMENWELFA